MRCGHCFTANLPVALLPLSDSIKLVRMLAQAGFRKINFAGGEPMLYKGLDDLIRAAKESGMTTSIVTNGTRITDAWLDGMSRYLDWIALSIDSSNPETHRRSGACRTGRSPADGEIPGDVPLHKAARHTAEDQHRGHALQLQRGHDRVHH